MTYLLVKSDNELPDYGFTVLWKKGNETAFEVADDWKYSGGVGLPDGEYHAFEVVGDRPHRYFCKVCVNGNVQEDRKYTADYSKKKYRVTGRCSEETLNALCYSKLPEDIKVHAVYSKIKQETNIDWVIAQSAGVFIKDWFKDKDEFFVEDYYETYTYINAEREDILPDEGIIWREGGEAVYDRKVACEPLVDSYSTFTWCTIEHNPEEDCIVDYEYRKSVEGLISRYERQMPNPWRKGTSEVTVLDRVSKDMLLDMMRMQECPFRPWVVYALIKNTYGICWNLPKDIALRFKKYLNQNNICFTDGDVKRLPDSVDWRLKFNNLSTFNKALELVLDGYQSVFSVDICNKELMCRFSTPQEVQEKIIHDFAEYVSSSFRVMEENIGIWCEFPVVNIHKNRE